MAYVIAVVAGNKAEFEDFVRWLEPADRRLFRYVHRADLTHGMQVVRVLRVGSWHRNAGRRQNDLFDALAAAMAALPDEVRQCPDD